MFLVNFTTTNSRCRWSFPVLASLHWGFDLFDDRCSADGAKGWENLIAKSQLKLVFGSYLASFTLLNYSIPCWSAKLPRAFDFVCVSFVLHFQPITILAMPPWTAGNWTLEPVPQHQHSILHPLEGRHGEVAGPQGVGAFDQDVAGCFLSKFVCPPKQPGENSLESDLAQSSTRLWGKTLHDLTSFHFMPPCAMWLKLVKCFLTCFMMKTGASQGSFLVIA